MISRRQIDGALVLSVPVGEDGLEPILGAAYMLMDRAYALLGGDGRKVIEVTLRPKEPADRGGLEDLARVFEEELEAQRLRWAVARANQPIREFIAEQAVLVAQGRAPQAEAPAPESGEQLTAEQREEIEKLISEVEAEIKEMNGRKAPADPKKLAASWEEKRENRGEGKP